MLARRALLVLALALPIALGTAPAHAGWGFWSTSPCRPDVWWYGAQGGDDYWKDSTPFPDGVHRVHRDFPNAWPSSGTFVDKYARYGYQCGFLGAPVNEVASYGGGWWGQGFEGGQLWYQELGNWMACDWSHCWWT